MIIKPPKRFQHDDENLMPMINIVFLLLVFFMIAGSLQSQDTLDVVAVKTDAKHKSKLDDQRLVVTANGEIGVSGEVFTLAELPTRLPQLVDAEAMASLQVKADASLTAATLHALLAALREAGVEKVRLLADRR